MNKNVKKWFLAILAVGAAVSSRAEVVDLDLFSGAAWSFYPGYEFPGAKGNRRVETVDGRNALILNYDFTGGGAYVAAGVPVEIAEGAKEVLLDAKADRPLKVIVRLEDSSKQTHQYQLLYEKPGEWQQLKIDLAAPPKGSFGGPKDGVIHYPLAKLWIGVGKGQTTADPGEASISGLKVVR